MTANINRDREKHPEPITPSDFFTPRCKPKAAPVTPEETAPEWKAQLASFELLNAALGGRDLRAERRAGLVDACGRPIEGAPAC